MKILFKNLVYILLISLVLIGCEQQKQSKVKEIDLSEIEKQDKIKKDLTPLSIPIEPNAIAHVNGQRTVIRTTASKLLNFDASSSYDPDGDNERLKYIWTNLNGYLLSTKKSFVDKYDKKGFDEITLRVKDEQNLTSLDRVCVLVDMFESEIPLIVRVEGKNRVIAGEKTYLEGRGVCRNDIVKYEWREYGLLLSNKKILAVDFAKGEHNITLTIEDMEGKRVTDHIIINAI